MPDSSDHSLFLIKLFNSSSPEGNCGECETQTDRDTHTDTHTDTHNTDTHNARTHTPTHIHTHNTHTDNTTQHNTTQHNTTQHNTTQHTTRQDKTRQDKTRQDKTRQDKREEKRKSEKRKREKRDIFKYTYKCISFQERLLTHVSVHTLTLHDAHYPPPPPQNPRTIQYLIPGWTTIVKLLKQVKNWQSPSRDPWSNCLINSREDDKGQSYYYSGRQKDNSKTICGHLGYP